MYGEEVSKRDTEDKVPCRSEHRTVALLACRSNKGPRHALGGIEERKEDKQRPCRDDCVNNDLVCGKHANKLVS